MAGREQAETEREFWHWLAPHWTVLTRAAARFAAPGERDDVLQDAVLLAQRKYQRYDPSRGSPAAWLTALVRDAAQRRRRRFLRTQQTPRTEQVLDHADASTARMDLEHAIRALPPRQREAVYLHYFLDLPVDEVAQVMGCAIGTAKSALHHARKALTTLLDRSVD